MNLKLFSLLVSISVFLSSCWKIPHNVNDSSPKVWGYKPVYGAETNAKKILYTAIPQPAINPGNIYAFQNYIFQMDQGFGIHVIDNSVPSEAKKIGFITVRGCSQISVKNDKLYTNSYDDLVVLDVSDLKNVKEYSRLKGVFTEFRYGSPLAEPPASGWYLCPSYDSLVVGWVQDSVFQNCYKN